MGMMKTPGVYIVEKNAFPNSVVEVATAVPAFIGYTEKAMNGSKSLINQPWRITSMAEFHSYFGAAPKPEITIEEDEEKKYKGVMFKRKHSLYYHMLFFYANGGGPCYIVSVGNYENDLDAKSFIQGIDTLQKEQEPTMVIAPEAVDMEASNCKKVYEAMLNHCAYIMKNRIALFDVPNGDKGRKDEKAGDVILKFREAIGSNFLNYAAAYYPWVNTAILQESDISLANLKEDSLTILQNLLCSKLGVQLPEKGSKPAPEPSTGNPPVEPTIENVDPKIKELQDLLQGITDTNTDKAELHKTLWVISPFYRDMMKDALSQINCMPVAAAMAGVFTMVDNTRGVWKAPANVSIANVLSPAVNLTNEDQEDLNVPLNGKSINAIRTFVGEGVKVWGARTLDGNSLDWRYINVRRTMIMLEESVKNAARAYVFDPNTSNTWVSVKSMISNFLNGIWKRGGLAGATPDDAFSVHVGLGETMTPEDILEGIMKITVLVAITRPAEFIEITFQQQMQKS